MQEMSLRDLVLVSGGNAEACKDDILAATALFGTTGGIIGGSIGSVVPVVGTAGGVSLGTGLGMLFGYSQKEGCQQEDGIAGCGDG